MQFQLLSELTNFLSFGMAIDLGTINTRIYMKDRGIVLNEPSVIATTVQDGQKVVVAVGEQARQMIGRTPDTIQAKYPLQNGVIADADLVVKMLSEFIKSVQYPKKIFATRPDVLMCIPAKATDVNERTFRDVTENAGVRRVTLLQQPFAAALGAGLQIKRPEASMIVDIGGGKTEATVISLSGISSVASKPVGGYTMNQAIRNFIREKMNLDIGENTTESIKIQIGSALIEKKIGTSSTNNIIDSKTPIERQGEEFVKIRGRDITGSIIPIEVTVYSSQIMESLEGVIKQITDTVEEALSKTGSELYLDLCKTGIYLTGGGCMLRNIEKVLAEKIRLPVFRTEHSLDCIALGAGHVLENREDYQDIIDMG